jgi:hypothetical protein
MWGSKRDGTLGAAAARHARLGGATGGRSGARRILIQLPRSSAMPQRRKWRNGLTGVSQTPASRGPRGRAEADHGSQYHKGLPPLMRKLVCVNALNLIIINVLLWPPVVMSLSIMFPRLRLQMRDCGRPNKGGESLAKAQTQGLSNALPKRKMMQ